MPITPEEHAHVALFIREKFTTYMYQFDVFATCAHNITILNRRG